MTICSRCLETFRCQRYAPLHGFLYHCQSEIVRDKFLGRLECGLHNPVAAEALAEGVQWVNLLRSKEILRALLSHGAKTF